MSIWTEAPQPPQAAGRLASRLNLPPPVAAALAGRGLHDPDAAARFLDPRLQHLGDPLAFPGVAPAAERLRAALRGAEPVTVFADFDADGVTAAAILAGTLRRLGGQAAVFFPDREREGYGLTSAAMGRCLAEAPCRVLVTVDCGMGAARELAEARDRGLDVVVTDHHAVVGPPPPALAVANPHLGATPGAEHLCGAGLAFKLVHALLKLEGGTTAADGTPLPDPREWLDAVAVATVADVVPLLGENRVLVAAGLRRLRSRPRPGLKALLHRAGLGDEIDSHHLAFVLGPRINAAGRMASAWPAFDLLAAADWDCAMARAVELEHLNQRRRQAENDVLAQALAQAAGLDGASGIAVGGCGWHPGILGIVAARLCDRFGRPAAVVALDAAQGGRGSVRAGPGQHAMEAMAACGECLERFGGHARAGGFTLRPGAFDAFRQAFDRACTPRDGAPARPPLVLDAWLQPEAIDPALWTAIRRLEPFGEGNPRPRWGLAGARLDRPPRTVGAGGEHLRLDFAAADRRFPAVWFRRGDLAPSLAPGSRWDLAFELHPNNGFGDEDGLDLHLVDIRPG